MSDAFSPWDPEGSRPPEPSGEDQGPDPEPIVRTVRVAFLLAGMLVAVIVNAGLNRLTGSAPVAGPGLGHGAGDAGGRRAAGQLCHAWADGDSGAVGTPPCRAYLRLR